MGTNGESTQVLPDLGLRDKVFSLLPLNVILVSVSVKRSYFAFYKFGNIKSLQKVLREILKITFKYKRFQRFVCQNRNTVISFFHELSQVPLVSEFENTLTLLGRTSFGHDVLSCMYY